MFAAALPFEESLASLSAEGLIRRRRLVDSPCGTRLQVEQREVLSFASNDYLGLANHPDIKSAMIEGIARWGAGSGASALVSGHQAPQETLEHQLAGFVGFPRALGFSTGYMANLGILPALAERGSAIFADKLNHASLIDAMQLACAGGASAQRYPHNDLTALERLLARSQARRKLIVTDAVFSMDGDLAPLPGLLELAERFDAWLLIDDAHGFGVLGPRGEGTLAHFGLGFQPRLILMATLGKAAGVAGAFVAASETIVEYLLQRARTYMFTTAAPPALACALCASLELIAAGNERRARLRRHAARLASGLAGLPWRLASSPTAIQPLIVGENQTAVDLAAALWQNGLWIPAIRPPAVPKGTARLRLSLSAAHRDEDIEGLIAALHRLA